MVEIIPGILEQSWDAINGKFHLVTGLVDWAQIEFADNTLVPNTTFLQFDKFSQLITVDNIPALEAHFMVANPEKYIKPAVDAGFRRLIAQVEAHDPRLFLDSVKHEDVEVGVAIDGPTEFEMVEPFLEEVDVVLVMMVEAGFSGGKFLPECIEKIKSIHRYLPDLPIEVEGGMSDKTARLVAEAGATRLVSTSYIFKDPADVAGAIERLKML